MTAVAGAISPIDFGSNHRLSRDRGAASGSPCGLMPASLA